MMRSPLRLALAVGLVLLGVGIVQTYLYRAWPPAGMVDGMMIAVALVALRVPFAGAVWTGAVGGLIEDALGGGILGLHAFTKTAVAAGISVLADVFAVRGQLMEALVVTAATALQAFIARALLLFLGWSVAETLVTGVIRAAVTGITCGLLTVGVPALIASWQRWRSRPRLKWR